MILRIIHFFAGKANFLSRNTQNFKIRNNLIQLNIFFKLFKIIMNDELAADKTENV